MADPQLADAILGQGIQNTLALLGTCQQAQAPPPPSSRTRASSPSGCPISSKIRSACAHLARAAAAPPARQDVAEAH